MILYKKVSKIYSGDVVALQDINLNIKGGEFVTLVGQSGAGKSTLLKLLYAEERPTMGEVFFDRQNIIDLKTRQLPYHRRNIGMVFQDFKLLSKKTLFENVAFAMEVAGKSNEEIDSDVSQILDIVGLGSKLDKYPCEVSGGEQQRAALARALVNKPKVLIADEPTGNLDPISTWDIVQLLIKINEYGTTVILATHNKSIVDKLDRRVVAMDRGKIVRDTEHGKYCI
ncbi:MAG: cell division ATP-binding protein FtsE [Candidatus Moranbacteria bacterium]|jgi:cell division transport system ATP-binding protein|nr:cell division ATP-binding protein FtsE [Candidatus Moranbacteria bacterium]